jgi:predicted glycosyltransferase
VLREMRDMEHYIDTIRDVIPFFISILIVHDPGSIELPSIVAEKARFVGEVARPLPIGSEQTPRSQSKSYPIVISGGGGGTSGALAFYNLTIQAVTQLYRSNALMKSLLVTGPLFHEWHLLQVTDAVTVVPFESDMSRRFSDADLVISLAGYNTIAELNSLRVKAICTPSWTPYDDQASRASQLAKDNPNVRLFEGTSKEDLASLITECLIAPYHDSAARAQTGALQAADYLCSIATL